MLREKDCKKIEKSFISTIKRRPTFALLVLGNLYRALDKADNEEYTHIESTISAIKQKLKIKDIERLWKVSLGKKINENNQKTVLQLQHEMLQDPLYFIHASIKILIQVGQKIEFYREVLIALIRRHLIIEKHNDPFLNNSFSYPLLRKGAAEQNFRYLAKFIKKCTTLPIDDLVLLGNKCSQIASLMLCDLNHSQFHFEISSRFAHLHSGLRKGIAKEWATYLETHALNKKESIFIHRELPKLKKQFPEFKRVQIGSRLRRDYTKSNEAHWNIYQRMSASLDFTVLGLTLAYPVFHHPVPLLFSIGANLTYKLIVPQPPVTPTLPYINKTIYK